MNQLRAMPRIRWVRWTLALGIALPVVVAASLYILYLGLVAFNSVNPMQLAFLTSFTMYNESGADVWVTPIGMWEGSGRYGPLPRYRNRYPPALMMKPIADISLPRDGKLVYTYDWDDINFRHVLVRPQVGSTRIVDTDRNGSLNGCYSPEQESYAIPPLPELANAPAELIPCTKGDSVRWKVIEYE